MRLLLDTQLLYWYFYDDDRLSLKVTEAMNTADSVFISSVSLWEIAIKVRIGKMKADVGELAENISWGNLFELPIAHRHILELAKLPLLHSDPFDRMLIAQAISEEMWLLTADAQLPQYSELVVRV